MATTQFSRLSSSHEQIRPIYDVIVIGSGCGGAVAACRAARTGQGVCVLEKGKEWFPSEFPESFADLRKNVHVEGDGETLHGNTPDLFSVHSCNNVTVLSGVGLGGDSLISANAFIEPEKNIFNQSWWPSKFQRDVENVFTVDANNVEKMLRPAKVLAVSKSKGIQAMQKGLEGQSGAMEDLGKGAQNVPLWVNFVEGSNPVGIKPPSCNGCGNCTTGCNTTAKTTITVNYLADAKAFGAEIFTETEVISLHRDSYTGLWSILYQRHSDDDTQEYTVKSNYVFLAAGSLGTSKILFQSKAKGLTVSDRLGYDFYCHSESFGVFFELDDAVIGTGFTRETVQNEAEEETNSGPANTTIVDVSFSSSSNDDGIMISDFTLPSSVRCILPAILNAESVKEGFSMVLDNDFNEATEGNKPHSIGNILTLHAINKRANKGRITYQKESILTNERSIRLDLETDENKRKNLEAKIAEISKKLGGRCAIFPRDVGIDGIFSTSPTGGCVMAKSGKDGVTNYKGKLFIGNTSDTHSGLYVIDSSTLPCSIGPYSAFSMCMLAERIMRIFTVDNVVATVRPEPLSIAAAKLYPHSCKKTEPGLKMTERMVGEVKVDDTQRVSPCEFVLTIESCDINRMMELDPQHASKITGTVTCPGFSSNPLTVSEGVFKLMRDSKEQIDGKEMIYLMVLNSEEGEQYYFYGIKYIHLDSVGETGLYDTTTLFVTIYKGQDDSGEQVAKGELKMKFTDFAKQLTTIEITNASGVIQQWKLKLKFVKFFLKGLWDTYSRLSGGSLLDPNAPPRMKRKLNLGDTEPEVYKVVTEDKVELRLTRYNGGRKGPVMLVHGLGVASNLFLMDTVDQNFVEYLVEHNYDVWLFDWRTSILLPKAAYSQYTVDDTAMYDFPAAVDKVLEVTSEKDIQIVIHCFGAIAVTASVLLGRLEGKVRCILTSQVSATPIGNVVNKFKSHGCFSTLAKAAGVKSLTAYVDKESPWSEKTLNHMTRNFAFATTKTDQHCSSEVCHRITFLYGLLFEHKNLNVASHDILHELFGVATAKILEHTALITRKERLIGFDGKDIYLPGYKKKHRLKDAQFRRKMDLMNIPIMFFNGELNQCWNPDNLVLTYNMVKEANPDQDYQLYEAEGYGHLDTFMGKRSNIDIFPNLVKWLDVYADDHDIKDLKIRNLIAKVLAIGTSRTVEDVLHVKPAKKIVNLLYPNDLDPELEIKFDLVEHDNRPNGDTEQNIAGPSSDHQDDQRSSDDTPQQQEQHQQQEDKADNKLRAAGRIKKTWERKVDTNSCFHQDPKYKNPEATKAEQVVVKVFHIDDESVKREIIAISDLYLGADWSKEIGPHLDSLLANLKEIAATYIHSIVLLGDVFELCNTPINVTPPSKEELMASWMSDEVICRFTSSLREISSESNVMLYYVRGDHDHDMTKALARELFGENVCFVPGSLIFKLDIGNRLYTMRFEHGHSADLFSDYDLLAVNSLERPLSYFLSRVLYSTEDQNLVETRKLLNTYVEKILKSLPSYTCGSTVMDILEMNLYSNQLCARLFDKAFERELTGDECIMMEENQWIRLKTIFKSNFIREAVVKYGSSEAYKMLQSSITDLSHHVKHCYEDVVVMGHIHNSFVKKVHGRIGNSIYANTGSWTDLTRHSYMKITLPRTSENGSIEVIALRDV